MKRQQDTYSYPENLTTEEREELTLVNFLAHTLLQERDKSAKQPVWLCMSEESKKEGRELAVEFVNSNLKPLIPVSLDMYGIESMERQLSGTPLMDTFSIWVQRESEFKQLREEGNPRAYFVS